MARSPGNEISFDLHDHVVPKKNSFHAGVARSGRKYQYRSEGAKTSQTAIATSAMVAARAASWGAVAGPVSVTMVLKRTRGDLVGLVETVLDAMQGPIYLNDRQVCVLKALWSDRAAMPLLSGLTGRVTVEEL